MGKNIKQFRQGFEENQRDVKNIKEKRNLYLFNSLLNKPHNKEV